MSDPYRCAWCGDPFVVPSLARWHETTCEARPRDEGTK